MSETAAAADSPATGKAPSMGTFERFLTLWVALCIIVGIGLGQAMPGVFHALGAATVAEINLPVAVLVWLMIIPMLLKIDLAALGQVRSHWRGMVATVGINWLVKPFSMALLGWLFIAPSVPASPACRSDRRLYRRPNSAGGGALHGHGVRLVEPCGRRAAFYAVTGRAQRHNHGGGLRAACGAAARLVLDHSAVGYARSVGRALHRRAGDRGAALAALAAGARRAGGACPNACAP